MSSHQHPYGKPENVLGFAEDSKVFVHDEPLRQMFLHPDVKHRKIVAFSIIGAYRKGKSFFLNYCLRYLYAHYPSINFPNNPVSNPDWIGDKDEFLKGFSWRSGSNRDTTGIVIWNDIFLLSDKRNDEKVAIIMVDSQGIFDDESSPMDSYKIFALGTLISSIQVLNLSNFIQEDQLQYLQFATEFARYKFADNQQDNGKYFQNLTFLIRDWSCPDEFECGFEGGRRYLENILKLKTNTTSELRSVRKFIHDSYEKLSCFLLPHPGKFVTGSRKVSGTNDKYNGCFAYMDEEFKVELTNLIEHLLQPDKLAIKKINGRSINGYEYFEHIIQYFKIFRSDEIPQAQSIYEITVEKQMDMLKDASFNEYKKELHEKQDKITCENNIKTLHEVSSEKALLMYSELKIMGNSIDYEKKYKQILETEIKTFYEDWSKKIRQALAQHKDAKRLIELKKFKLQNEIEQERMAVQEIEKFQLENEKIHLITGRACVMQCEARDLNNRTHKMDKIKKQMKSEKIKYVNELLSKNKI